MVILSDARQQLAEIYAREAKGGQLLLPETIVHYQQIAEGVARGNNHRLGDWKKDNGEYFGYGFYALCAHKDCVVFGWVTDRDGINSSRGSIYGPRVCPVRKRKKD